MKLDRIEMFMDIFIYRIQGVLILMDIGYNVFNMIFDFSP